MRMTEPDMLPFAGVSLATLPPASRYPGKVITITDLHEGLGGRARSNGSVWVPALSDAIAYRPAKAIELKVGVHRPVQIFTGTVASLFQVTFSTAGAFNGARFTVMRQAAGLAGIGLLSRSLPTGSWADVVFDGTKWLIVRSQGLL